MVVDGRRRLSDESRRRPGFLRVPNAWAKSPSDAIALGKQLIEAIEHQNALLSGSKAEKSGRTSTFTSKPDLIEELDHLSISERYIDSEVEPLLTHLKIMRSSSSWNYSPDAISPYPALNLFTIGRRRSLPKARWVIFTPGAAWRRLYSLRSTSVTTRATTSGSKPSFSIISVGEQSRST